MKSSLQSTESSLSHPPHSLSPPLSDLALMVEALQNLTAAPKLETRRRHDRALECQDWPLTLLSLKPWEIRHTFQQILAALYVEWQVFHKDGRESITNVKTSCEVKAFNDQDSS